MHAYNHYHLIFVCMLYSKTLHSKSQRQSHRQQHTFITAAQVREAAAKNNAIYAGETSSKLWIGVEESLDFVMQNVMARDPTVLAAHVLILLDLLVPSTPTNLSRLPSDIRLMVWCF